MVTWRNCHFYQSYKLGLFGTNKAKYELFILHQEGYKAFSEDLCMVNLLHDFLNNFLLLGELSRINCYIQFIEKIGKMRRFDSCGLRGREKKIEETSRTLKRKTQPDHKGHNNLKCESCGKLFSQAGYLKKHTHAVHQGHKDYKCGSCGKSFYQAGSLKIHIHEIHEGHKDYKCVSCGKSFSMAHHLKMHIHTIHEGHKDYKCVLCGKSFSQAVTLKRHIQTVHEGHKDYKCESCGKSFSSAGSLNKHVHTVHKGHNTLYKFIPK